MSWMISTLNLVLALEQGDGIFGGDLGAHEGHVGSDDLVGLLLNGFEILGREGLLDLKS